MSDSQLKDPQHPSGPVSVHNLTMHVDRDLCIGAATCVAIAPQTFNLDDEAKAVILDTVEKDDENTIVDSAKGCPVAAIIITDKDGNKVYPK